MYKKFRNRRPIRPKRRFRRRRAVKKIVNTIPRINRGFSDALYTKINYVSDPYLFTAGTGSKASFYMNSIYDCEVIVGNTYQPLYHDQLATLYNRYKVYGLKVHILATNSSATEYAILSVIPRVTNSDSGVVQMEEDQRSITRVLTPLGGSRSIASINKYYNLKSIFKTKLLDDDYGALFGNNPGKLFYLQCMMMNQDRTTTIACRFEIKMTFYLKAWERNLISRS